MKKLSIILTAAFSLLSLAVTAQEKENEFYVDVQLRGRAEYRNGVLSPRNEGVLPSFFINERARLGLGYNWKWLSLKLSGQHVGVWGQDAQINKSGNFILNEAWAKMELGKGFYTQLGRQALVYDDERILGGLDWNVAGRYHDVAKVGFKSQNKMHQVDLLLAFNQSEEKKIGGTYYDGGQPYKTMQTLWYHLQTQGSANVGMSLLFMNLGYEAGSEGKSETINRQTMGTYLTFRPGKFAIDGTFYYQTGKQTKLIDISAFMAAVKASAQFTGKVSANIGYDYLSGQNWDSEKYTCFDPLYGTHHKFYGSMDYFSSASIYGLQDGYVGIGVSPVKPLNLQLTGHCFGTAAKLADIDIEGFNGEKKSRYLGTELDFQVTWKINGFVTLMGGYSTMFGSKYMDIVKGGDHNQWQDWGWIQLNINPRIFSTKW